MRKRKNKFDKWFFLNWRKLLIIIGMWFLAVILHNLISAIFGIEEALFFIIAVFVIPVYFIALIIYTLVKFIRRRHLR